VITRTSSTRHTALALLLYPAASITPAHGSMLSCLFSPSWPMLGLKIRGFSARLRSYSPLAVLLCDAGPLLPPRLGGRLCVHDAFSRLTSQREFDLLPRASKPLGLILPDSGRGRERRRQGVGWRESAFGEALKLRSIKSISAIKLDRRFGVKKTPQPVATDAAPGNRTPVARGCAMGGERRTVIKHLL